MNAAARAINQSNLFTGQWSEMRISKQMSLILTLLFALLVSALAVIYITNEHRLRFDYLQQLEQHNHQLQLQWGQLLLEQASLATSARVEQIAIEKLRMRLPADKQTYILQAK